MSEFYTYVYANRRGVFYRGYREGVRIKEEITDYKPSLFVPTNEPTPYKTILDQPVRRLQFDTIEQAQDFKRSNDQLEHEYLAGCTRYQFTYISDKFEHVVEFDSSIIRKATIDIEVDSSNGFSSPQNPYAPIITMTIKYRGIFYVFGLKPYRPTSPTVKYNQFPDEQTMLKTFIQFWQKLDLDVLFGWNTDGYDIPYIVNRLRRLFGEKAANALSPWSYIRDSKVNFRGQLNDTYEIVGITSLDYIDLYRRYMPKAESDKLNAVAEEELGETKLEYDGTLHELYTKDFDKFIEYNVQDVALVEKLDAKLKLADMVITTAYDAKCNFSDVLQQVRMWDAITFNELKRRKIAVPFIRETDKEDKFPGAFVLPAQVGKHKWVVSFDFASLYPSLIIEHNISPDTILQNIDEVSDGQKITYDEEGMISRLADLSFLKEKDLTCSGAGWTFEKGKKGFLGEILERMFQDRMRYKRAMKDAEKNLAQATTEEEKNKWANEVVKYNNFQLAKKVQLNAAYGSLGSKYFRFFDLRLATSVTLSGRGVLLQVKEHLTKRLQEEFRISYDPIIYGDTDSLYITAKPFVAALNEDCPPSEIVERIHRDYCEKMLRKYIDEALEAHRKRYNTYARQIEMVRDVIAEDTIFVSKKRYLMEIWDKEGIRYQRPKRKATGLEMIKSSTPKFCKEWLHKAADSILKGTQNDLEVMVNGYRKEFEKRPLEIISYPVGVSKIEEYTAELSAKKRITFEDTKETGSTLKKGAPIQVAAAFAYNRFLENEKLTEKYDRIKSNVRMRYFYLKDQNPYRAHVMGMLDKVPSELQLQKWIDYERQFAKVFIGPLNILLEAVGWRLIGEAPSIMGIFD